MYLNKACFERTFQTKAGAHGAVSRHWILIADGFFTLFAKPYFLESTLKNCAALIFSFAKFLIAMFIAISLMEN
jgi:hypothetical protein